MSRRQGCVSLPSVDLAGRAIALSPDVPDCFDAPLAPHHRLIGRWAAPRESGKARYTRVQARRRIEKVFNAAVLEILEPFKLADLRVIVLYGEKDAPPAIAVICDTVGQIELNWIERSNVLRDTLFTQVAPVGWRAAAYEALGSTLNSVLPIFGFDDLMEEMAAYYWEGETDDIGATKALIEWHCAPEDEIDAERLPSGIRARRPDWMTAKAAPMKDMPAALRKRIRKLRDAAAAVRALGDTGNAWHFDFQMTCDYMPHFEDCSHLPAMTLVPVDHFSMELDDVGQFGMQQGFMDVAGICSVADPAAVDAWFSSLRIGLELLSAAQDLITLDPCKE